MRIGLTGNPGTGKNSVGRELARLTGLELVSLGDFSIKAGLGSWNFGEFSVDTERFRSLRIDTRGKIISGHLLPYLIPKEQIDFVAILRCSPGVLRRRYISRGYSRQKINENVEAEVLDLLSFKCLESYGKDRVAEFDTSRIKRPGSVARRIVNTVTGKIPRHYGIASWSLLASRSPAELRKLLGGRA